MTDERKATDVLLDIESEVKKLSQTMSSLMLAQTLSLDKLNRVYNYISNLEKEIEEEKKLQLGQAQTANHNLPIQSPQATPIEVESNPQGVRRTSRQPEAPPADAPMATSNPGERKIPVIQRVTDHSGKDLFMADVRIINANKEVVAKVKTNPVGKWQALVPPGQYDVHILKTDTASKTKIEAMQTITVPDNTGIFTLPIIAIKKRE
jgi:murein DD-endopeptidase MepM/ murein hydrolase activator NlpD